MHPFCLADASGPGLFQAAGLPGMPGAFAPRWEAVVEHRGGLGSRRMLLAEATGLSRGVGEGADSERGRSGEWKEATHLNSGDSVVHENSWVQTWSDSPLASMNEKHEKHLPTMAGNSN